VKDFLCASGGLQNSSTAKHEWLITPGWDTTMTLSSKQFKKFSDLVYHECGINLHDGKQQLLQARLAKRLRATDIGRVDEYLALLETDDNERKHFIDSVSTNHTFFFRESHHFECLQNTHRNIWCAASSSGEEPYSIAIHCLEKGFKPNILATDISTKVLNTGQQGVYPIEKTKSIPATILKKYFQKGHGNMKGYVKVKDGIKKMVTFGRFNLLTDLPPNTLFDIVFCRNVLIYFDNLVKARVVEKLYDVLIKNGHFIIGGAESLNNIKHRYQYIRPSVYMKV
jgi:chemotaxis protein methyltransferase CheR